VGLLLNVEKGNMLEALKEEIRIAEGKLRELRGYL